VFAPYQSSSNAQYQQKWYGVNKIAKATCEKARVASEAYKESHRESKKKITGHKKM
jgi:hypothetical protein